MEQAFAFIWVHLRESAAKKTDFKPQMDADARR
jgi:hypothetical protein